MHTVPSQTPMFLTRYRNTRLKGAMDTGVPTVTLENKAYEESAMDYGEATYSNTTDKCYEKISD